MPDPPKPPRFQIALSFPGEHRSRVEAIANALAKDLGKEKILYDKWYEAEFARPNLDEYLVNLYHDHSRLLVFFHCEEYDQKEWCGLEDRAGRDLLKHRQDDRLMFLRLDQAGSDGRLSIDGYLDIRTMPDPEVAAQILKRLHLLDPVAPTPPAVRIFTANLPAVDTLLIGRDTELAFLEKAWTDSANIVQIIAPGGTGKTALMDKWFRRHLNEVTIFGWSFYSQGTQQDRQTSSDPFFAEIIPFFGIKIPEGATVYARAEAIAQRLREEKVLLILDGLEPLQESTGELRDNIKYLLQELRTHNAGMVLCTTRIRVKDLLDDEQSRSCNLENLHPKDGASLLGHLGVKGTLDELEQASNDYGNHALALTLLGTYLRDFQYGDIRHRTEIRGLLSEESDADGHASRVMAGYAKMFKFKPERQILKALGYFDRPAEPEAIRLVLKKMDDEKYHAALVRLKRARLILSSDPSKEIDCHPLVREYFASVARATAAEAFKKGHGLLYEHYSKKAPSQPGTREEMIPLFFAVYHGCQAGQYVEACDKVCRDRIHRGSEFYLVKKLGEFGSNLSLLVNLFEMPWIRPARELSPRSRAWVLNVTAHTLRSLGRLKEALDPMQAGAEAAIEQEDWESSARTHMNLTQLNLALGNLSKAVAAGYHAVEYADRGERKFERCVSRAILAETLHGYGDWETATQLFREAEALQAQDKIGHPILHSSQGFYYCNLLLDQAQHAEVLRRATHTIKTAEVNFGPLAVGLDNLSLGRAYLSGSAESGRHLDQAIHFLHHAGNLVYLPLALLARATDHDLEEAFRIATRSGMRLHLADYHLIQARRLNSIEHFKEAERLINETGYRRRDQSLADLRKELFPHQPHPA